MHIRQYIDILIFCFVFSKTIKGSHFRGADLSWKPTNNNNEVEISYRTAWRRSSSSNHFCDSGDITAGNLLTGEGNIQCFSGCSGTLSTMSYYCTDFDITEDWSSGERSFQYTFPNTSNMVYEFGFTGGAWISLVQGGGTWMLKAMANLTERSDTGGINSSPISAMTPILRLQHGCNHSISIPGSDPDGDFIRCRWAESSRTECGSVCKSFPGAVLDERNCILNYTANETTGWYAVALQIEDFKSPITMNPLSSIPLQFLVQVFTSDKECDSKPVLIEETPKDGSCIVVPLNSTYTANIIANSSSSSIRITSINTVSPTGMIKSVLQPSEDFKYSWYINVTWKPTKAQIGSNIFCFSAVNTAGLTSEQRCVVLVYGVPAPAVINGSQSPTGEINTTHSIWSLEFDKEIEGPSGSRYIRFHNVSGTVVYSIDTYNSKNVNISVGSRNMLTFTTGFVFEESTKYYITYEKGIVRDVKHCRIEVEDMVDPFFWRFYTRSNRRMDTTSISSTVYQQEDVDSTTISSTVYQQDEVDTTTISSTVYQQEEGDTSTISSTVYQQREEDTTTISSTVYQQDEVDTTTISSTVYQQEEGDTTTISSTVYQQEEEDTTTISSTVYQQEEGDTSTISSTVYQQDEEDTTTISTTVYQQEEEDTTTISSTVYQQVEEDTSTISSTVYQQEEEDTTTISSTVYQQEKEDTTTISSTVYRQEEEDASTISSTVYHQEEEDTTTISSTVYQQEEGNNDVSSKYMDINEKTIILVLLIGILALLIFNSALIGYIVIRSKRKNATLDNPKHTIDQHFFSIPRARISRFDFNPLRY